MGRCGRGPDTGANGAAGDAEFTLQRDTLAWAYYYKGAYGFARDLLEDAVKINPKDPAMQYHLGMVYGKLGNKSDAAAHSRMPFRSHPARRSPSRRKRLCRAGLVCKEGWIATGLRLARGR